MLLLCKLALRNLREHWIKTLILGVIIFNSVWVLMVSSSFLGMAREGIRETFINNFTGDVVIKARSVYPYSLFGVQAPGGIEENPPIPDMLTVRNRILQEYGDQMEGFTMLATGGALISFEEQKKSTSRGVGMLFGIDGNSYFGLFRKLNLIEGRFLESGEKGIMISVANREELREELGHPVNIGNLVKLTGMSNAGPRIREVPLVGVYQLGEIDDERNYMCYIDIQTLRALKGMNLSAAENIQIEEDKTELLGKVESSDALDDLFAGEELFLLEDEGSEEFNEEDFFALFETSITEETEQVIIPLTPFEEQIVTKMDYAEITGLLSDRGPREFMLIKLKQRLQGGFPGSDTAPGFIRRANRLFIEENLAVTAGNWKEAAGPFAGMADLIVVIYSIVIIMVIVIAFFIVINTLVISVVQRKREVGTMRALGAQRHTVALLFTIEIILTSVIFTFFGIIFAAVALFVLGLFQIEATNSLFAVIFNGPVLNPVITGSQVLWTTIIVLLIGIISNLLPLSIAMKIQPVEAMRE